MTNIMMIAGLLLFLGLTYLWHVSFHYTEEEGLLLTACVIVILMFVSGTVFSSFNYGMTVLVLLGLAGIGVFFFKAISLKMIRTGNIIDDPPKFTVGLLCFICLFLLGMVLFYKDFIQHLDELHQWALLVKKMLRLNSLSAAKDFPGSMYCFSTTMFHLFFQKLGGYSEQNMYVSSFVMMWIGMLLPFSGFGRSQWKKIILYIVIMLTALYSIYPYGFKNLYVDLVTASWAAGLSSWWVGKDSKSKKDIFLLALGLIVISFAKPYVGLLMSAVVIFLVLWERYLIRQGIPKDVSRVKLYFRIITLILVVALLGIIIILFYFIRRDYSNLGIFVHDDLVQKTVGSFAKSTLGYALNKDSNWNITFFSALVFFIFMWKLLGDWSDKKEECRLYASFTILWNLGYLMVLLFAYLFIFPKAEASISGGIRRYASIPVTYNLLLFLSQMYRTGISAETTKKIVNVSYMLILFFMMGLNANFIPYNTSWMKEDVKGYEDIRDVKKGVKSLEECLTENDKVYYINQKVKKRYSADISGNMVRYELEDRVSNFLVDPWYFYKGGCRIRISTKLTDMDLADLPELLEKGNYTYVWIFNTNSYLNKNLPKVIPCENVKNNVLYRIIYNENQKVIKLQMIKR